MDKFLSNLFVGFFVLVEHLRRSLTRPVAWLVVALLVFLCWGFFTKSGSNSLSKLVGKPPPKQAPIVFQPDPKEAAIIRPDVIESAVGRFHLNHGRLPKDWDELDADKIITGMPAPPPGKKYVLSPSKMEVLVVDK